jgi:predicted N-acetyltransferase YhbS
MITIRKEQRGDEEQIRLVNTCAFGQPAEADVVDTLRKACPEGVSLVAVCEDKIVGHILFTPAVIEAKEKEIRGMGLAPMSVQPEFQRQGIGSKLVQAGLDVTRLLCFGFQPVVCQIAAITCCLANKRANTSWACCPCWSRSCVCRMSVSMSA